MTWRSKMQEDVARSSTEAKFWVMTQGYCELLWLRILHSKLRMKKKKPEIMTLYCDHKAATNMAYNPVQHDRTKHVEIDWHFIEEKVA